MFAKIVIFLSIFPCLISTKTIELTDDTWKEMLNGQWMVEFYAPWCPACQQFKSIWNDFSNSASSQNIKVAAVDVDKYPALSGRFHISSLPTIYHVHDGIFREYQGGRSFRDLNKYIQNEEWQNVQPISPYLAPNGILMSLTGSLLEVSSLVKDGYRVLHDEYNLPVWLIYVIFGTATVLVGIIMGFGALVMLDCCIGFLSKSRKNNQSDETDDSDDNEINNRIDASSKSDKSGDDSNEEGNISDMAEITDEEQERTTDQTVRQRRVDK